MGQKSDQKLIFKSDYKPYDIDMTSCENITNLSHLKEKIEKGKILLTDR